MTVAEKVLARYTQIEASELADKRIAHIYTDDETLIFITDENEYVSLFAARIWDDAEFQTAELKIGELQSMGLLTHNEWVEHGRECEGAFFKRQREGEITRFKAAARTLGLSAFQIEKLILEKDLTDPTS